MLASLIYLVFGFIDLLTIFRFIFLLIGANPSSQIVSWVYSWSNIFVAPFNNILGEHTVNTVNSSITSGVFDWGAFIALIFYTLVGATIGQFLTRKK